MPHATRSLAGAAVCLATLATPLALPAAQAATSPAQAWAAFAQAPAWVNKADNVQWYVASGALPRTALNRVVTLTATSPATIDCANLGAGYGTDAGWTSLTPRRAVCTPTRATWSIKVTRAMIGKEVSLNGWTAAGASTQVTINGTVRVGSSVTKVSSTAKRATAPAPVGPLVSLGSYNGQQVSIATGNLVNEVWLGTGSSARRWAAPDGKVWHASLVGTLVNLWYQDTNQLNHWQLDLATGKVTTQTVAMYQVFSEGKPGFWTVTTDHLSTQLYDWSGNLRATRGYYPSSMNGTPLGFTDKYATWLPGGQGPTGVTLQPLDGSPAGTWNLGHYLVMGFKTDATGGTVTYAAAGGGMATCRVEWASSTCPGSWSLGA